MTDPGAEVPPASAFYAELPGFSRFSEEARAAASRPLPDGWWVGVTDVEGSTRAIAEGRYKAVNVAGAAAIGALSNALGSATFPFAFGGDGATFAVWPQARVAALDALARTARWAQEDLSLVLRAALVPIEAVRAASLDVTVARFQASPGATYAMFGGGGGAWAAAQMKAGRYAVAPAPPGARPDLAGLSCRWTPADARHGAIVSIIVQPRAGAPRERVAELFERVIALVRGLDREGHPLPDEGPGFAWPPAGLELEARASRREGEALALRRAKVGFATLAAWVLHRTGWKVGGFDPAVYCRTTSANADYRKFEDGLLLTIDCDDATRARIERELAAGAAAGLVDYGVHAQKSALVTCLVASPLTNDHLHFVDGADGGYTRAAAFLKASLQRAAASVP